MVLPVRITGLEQTPFTRLSRAQVRRRWFPKVTVTVLEPVKLTVDLTLKDKHRRQAADVALYGIMSDLVFRTTSTDRTVVDAVIQAAKIHGFRRVAVEDPMTGALNYQRLLLGAAILGRKLMPYAAEGKAIGVMLPNANAAAITMVGLMSAGRVPARRRRARSSRRRSAGRITPYEHSSVVFTLCHVFRRVRCRAGRERDANERRTAG